MRDALRNLTEDDYWLYGPGTHEFDHVVELVQKYSEYADACIDRMTLNDAVSPEFADAQVEASSDLRYYNHFEKGLLWSFALWRLQGMFEAVLVSRYLPAKPTKRLSGLRAKLEAVAAAGYRTSKVELDELEAWGRLRNTLSHAPPEHFHPVAVDRQDIDDYVALLKRVCESWNAQRPRSPDAA
jgi:hypothetical protein